jgi:hypothetical protein
VYRDIAGGTKVLQIEGLTRRKGRLFPNVLIALSRFLMIIGCSTAVTSRSGTLKKGAALGVSSAIFDGDETCVWVCFSDGGGDGGLNSILTESRY